jgi:hypothetical protein
MIKREEQEWGIQLTIRPFADKPQEIRAEIVNPRPGRGPEVKISFTGVTFSDPLKLVESQTWIEAMTALITETRSVMAEIKGKK